MDANPQQIRWKVGRSWTLVAAAALGAVAGHEVSLSRLPPPGPLTAPTNAPLPLSALTVPGPGGTPRPRLISPLERMPGPDLLRARATAEEEPLRRGHRWENFGAALAGSDPATIRTQLEGLTGADRAAVLRGLFFQLGNADPREALAHLGSLKLAGEDGAAALTALVDRWTAGALQGPGRRVLLVHAASLKVGLGQELLQTDPPRLDLAQLWADQVLSPGREQTDLLAGIAREMVATDPAAAMAIGRNLDGQHYVRFVKGVVGQWAHRDPMAANAWLEQNSDPGLRAAARDELIAGLLISGLTGPQSMVGVFDGLPLGETRTQAIPQLAQMLAARGAENALRWADTLANPVERATARAAVDEASPIVTGVGMTFDIQEGMPIVTGLLANTPAGTSGQILPGDRILAVAQADGQFVGVQGMTGEEVRELVRGMDGSPVQLRVTSPLAGGYGPPRLVSLVRTVLPRK